MSPSDDWTTRLVPGKEPARAYGLLLLWAMAGADAPGSAEETESAAGYLREELTAAQAREAEAWAERTFRGRFGGRPPTGGVPAACAETQDR